MGGSGGGEGVWWGGGRGGDGTGSAKRLAGVPPLFMRGTWDCDMGDAEWSEVASPGYRSGGAGATEYARRVSALSAW